MIQNSYASDQITPAESTRHSWEEEDKRLARDYDLQCRRLELEVLRLDNRWASWLKIPVTILKLPVYLVMAVAYCIAMARKHEPSEKFWELLK